MIKSHFNLIIDSGAYSIKTFNLKNKKVATSMEEYLDNYIEFCLLNKDQVSYFVNLDVIPIDSWSNPIKSHAVLSAEEGWNNYWYMVNKGVPQEKLIHVFHRDEPMDILAKMVEAMPYIGLSPGRRRKINQKIPWLDNCMRIICDRKGYPKVKFHGFAVTSLHLIKRYPWYSVDSTSWSAFGRHGTILVPARKNSSWRYDLSSWTLGVTKRSPFVSKELQHYKNLTPNNKKIVDQYLDEKGYVMGISEIVPVDSDYALKRGESWYEKGVSIERVVEKGVSNDNALRNELNIIFYQDLATTQPEWPWPFKHKKRKKFFS